MPKLPVSYRSLAINVSDRYRHLSIRPLTFCIRGIQTLLTVSAALLPLTLRLLVSLPFCSSRMLSTSLPSWDLPRIYKWLSFEPIDMTNSGSRLGSVPTLRTPYSFFEVADATIRSADQPNDIEATVYHAHGRFLNVLANLHGEAPHRWPALPSAPTFSSKHAPHVADPLDVGSLTPPAQPPAALPLVSPAPSSRKDKGKGRAIEPVPLFLEASPSVEPEAALATEPPSDTIPGLPELGELSSPEPDLQSSLEPFADMALDLAFPGEEPDASSTDEEDGAYQEEGEGSGGEEGEEY